MPFARGIRPTFSAAVAVERMEFAVRPGELGALLGPNGAGKTTTLRMIAGLLRPDAGTICIFGIDALAEPIAAKRITAWLPDEPMLYDTLSPLEYLERIARLWGVPAALAEGHAAKLIDLLALGPKRRQHCKGFSRGMKPKVALASTAYAPPPHALRRRPHATTRVRTSDPCCAALHVRLSGLQACRLARTRL